MPLLPPDSTSIGSRLLLLLLVPLLAVLAISVGSDYRTALAPARAAYDKALADAALALAAYVQVRDGAIALDISPEALALLRAERFEQTYYAVYGPRGERIIGDPDLPRVPIGEDNPAFLDAEYQGQPVRAVGYRTVTRAGPVVIEVAETVVERRRAARRIVGSILVANVALIAAALLVVYIGVRTGLSPLWRLRTEIEARSPRDLRALDEARVPREVLPLVSALNRLLHTLRESNAAQQRFLTNAAHQLRTPLAGLQAQLDLLVSEPMSEAARERVERSRSAVRRAARLAAQLLSLARAESSTSLTRELTRVDLRTVAEETGPDFLDQAIARKVDLGFELEPALIDAVPWTIRELLGNLIDNAIRYGSENGRVTVRCGVRDGSPILEVEDDGPGIPQDERGRVLERFYRAQGTSGTGSGLGLAIVQEIAQLHGAQVLVGTGEGGKGTRISVNFKPLAA